MSGEELQLAAVLISDRFGESGEALIVDDFEGRREALEAILALRIAQLLRDDFEQLAAILYRIDVEERKFHGALSDEHPEHRIARDVVDRMLQKAQSRIRYRNKGEF